MGACVEDGEAAVVFSAEGVVVEGLFWDGMLVGRRVDGVKVGGGRLWGRGGDVRLGTILGRLGGCRIVLRGW